MENIVDQSIEPDEVKQLIMEIDRLKENLLTEAHLRKIKYFERLTNWEDYSHYQSFFS